MPPAGSRPTWEYRFTRALCHGALQLPLVVVTVGELARGWRPTSDDANIAMRASMVFTAHSPLVGQYTQATQIGHHATYDLGPLLYWMLAVPVRLDAQQGALWGAAFLLSLALALIVEAAWAVGRRPAAVAATVLAAAVLIAEPRMIADPVWNPYVATIWTMVAAASAWAVVNGRTRWLPVLVFAASFAGQAHLAAVIPSASLVVLAVVAGIGPPVAAAVRRRARLGWKAFLPGGGDPPPPAARPWVRPVAVSGLVALACWIAPLIQEVTTTPGNITLLLRGVGGGASFGMVHGIEAMGSTIVPWPVWLDGHQATTFFGALAAISRPGLTLSLVALVPVVAVVALRRVFGPVHASAALVVLVVLVADAATVGAIPMSGLLNVVYLFPMEWPAGIAAVVVVAAAAVRVVVIVVPRAVERAVVFVRRGGAGSWTAVRQRWAHAAGVAGLVASGAVVITVAGPLVTRAWPASPTLGGWRAVSSVSSVAGYLEQVLPRKPVLLRTQGNGTIADYEVIFGVAWQLHVDGRDVQLIPDQAAYASPTLAPSPGTAATVVYVHNAGSQVDVEISEGGRTAASRTFPT